MEGQNLCEKESSCINIEENCAENVSDNFNKHTECVFYLEGKCLFGEKCKNIHVGNIEQKIDKKNKNKVTITANVTADTSKKKLPLRTAGDVRKRIQWDESLQREHFTIGYLDRFEGIVEKPFTDFVWKDLADAELDDLAIPEHRIHYFKYKERKVWDKDLRLDYVFGSAGNTKNIMQIITESQEEEGIQNDDLDDEDSDSEGDIVVVSSSLSAAGAKECVAAAQEIVKKKEKLRATHFLCIRIQNEALAEIVCRVQETVIKCDPLLRSCAMPAEILHITLAMIKCESASSVNEVSALLTQIREEIITNENYNRDKNVIKAKHLSTFGSRVLYSKLEVTPLFSDIINILQSKIKKLNGVTITNHFDFVPHMTLLKVNRFIAKERRSKYIDSSLYAKYFSQEFGEIHLNNIYFCIINDYRGEDGFYLTCKKIEF